MRYFQGSEKFHDKIVSVEKPIDFVVNNLEDSDYTITFQIVSNKEINDAGGVDRCAGSSIDNVKDNSFNRKSNPFHPLFIYHR